MKIDAHLPDGSTVPLIWIKDWDFNWQGAYTYASPVKLPKGTRIDLEYTYDNSEKNPRNPGEFTALLLLGALGLMLLVGSEELLMIFIGLELLGLSLYVMAGFDKSDVRSKLGEMGVSIEAGGPAAFAALTTAEIAKWSKLIRLLGLKPEG